MSPVENMNLVGRTAAAAEVAKLGRRFRQWQRAFTKAQGTETHEPTRMGFFGSWLVARDAADECDKAVARLVERRKAKR